MAASTHCLPIVCLAATGVCLFFFAFVFAVGDTFIKIQPCVDCVVLAPSETRHFRPTCFLSSILRSNVDLIVHGHILSN